MKVVVIGGGWAGCAIQLKLMLIKTYLAKTSTFFIYVI